MVKDLRGCPLNPDRIRYWAKAFGVTESELREALDTVGLQSDDRQSDAISTKLNKLLLARRQNPDPPGGRDT